MIHEHCKVILFQGDSITDCGRDRSAEQSSNHYAALGSGYAGKIAGQLLSTYPAQGLNIFNRGIGGNRIVDLYARWKADAINLVPDCISILIGVNDLWHEFGSKNGVELDRFEQVYRMLMKWTFDRLPTVRMILCDPFVLRTGVVTSEWQADIFQRQKIVARLAGEFNAIHVPFQNMFDAALDDAPRRVLDRGRSPPYRSRTRSHVTFLAQMRGILIGS